MKRLERIKIGLVYTSALLLLLLIAVLIYRSTSNLIQTIQSVTHTQKALIEIEATQAAVTDAETGRRGFVITGGIRHLDAYHAALQEIPQRMRSLRGITSDNPNQQRRLDRLDTLIATKLAHLKESIELRKAQGLDAARQSELTDQGKEVMDEIRAVTGEMEREERQLLSRRVEDAEASTRAALRIFTLGTLAGLGLILVAFYRLNLEISQRMRMEEEVRKLNDELEQRVAKRTGELESANRKLRDANRALKTLSECNQALVRATDESKLVQQICDLVVNVGGYRLAWVGYSEGNDAQTIRPVAVAGTPREYVESARAAYGVTDRGVRPSRIAMQTGTTSVVNDTQSDPAFSPWRTDALKYGFNSCIAIPLMNASKPSGVFCLYSAESGAFHAEEVQLLEELGRDLAFGIASLRTRESHRRAEEALRRSEADLREAQRVARVGSWSLEANAGIPTWSEEIYRIFGLDPKLPPPSVKEHPQYFTPESWARLQEALERALQSAAPYEIELEVVRRDQTKRWMIARGEAERDATGRVTRLLGTVQDVTERRNLEEQYRQAQKMESIGRMAGGIAHDFNNLLTIINGYGQLMLERLAADDPLRTSVEAVCMAGERAASLTRQLLAFSRQQILSPRVLDLNELVAGIKKMLGRVIGEDIDLVARLDPKLGRVKADPGQIEQVIMNLVVNARDAMPKGGKLTIQTGNAELDNSYVRSHSTVVPGRYVMLAISDTGVGMDAGIQARIFEPFFTTKERGKGTGLGLATVYGIVKQSGGHIWVYSEPDRGTSFKVYLPCFDEVPAEGAEVRAQLPRGSETVLVVEDEEGVRMLIRSVLESNGYRVLEAEGAAKALELGERSNGKIHLVLTDVVMPEMGGSELAERLARLHPETKVLFMSGYTDDAIVRHGVLKSELAFLEKPFTPEALVRKVREVLDGVELRGT
ncbi:MAG: CHASE3 domain-containing protein [Terriglobia bacterium]